MPFGLEPDLAENPGRRQGRHGRDKRIGLAMDELDRRLMPGLGGKIFRPRQEP